MSLGKAVLEGISTAQFYDKYNKANPTDQNNMGLIEIKQKETLSKSMEVYVVLEFWSTIFETSSKEDFPDISFVWCNIYTAQGVRALWDTNLWQEGSYSFLTPPNQNHNQEKLKHSKTKNRKVDGFSYILANPNITYLAFGCPG